MVYNNPDRYFGGGSNPGDPLLATALDQSHPKYFLKKLNSYQDHPLMEGHVYKILKYTWFFPSLFCIKYIIILKS